MSAIIGKRAWALLAAGAVCAGRIAVAQQPAVYRWAHVTYVSFETIYIDAGTEDGLRLGSLVDVVRRDSAVAQLAISFISGHRAACSITTRTDTVRVGDSVRFTPVRETGDSVRTAAAAPSRRLDIAPRTTGGSLRGLIGLDYLLVRPQDGGGAQLSQPAATLRLQGSNLGGTGLSLALDLRGRRLSRTRADGFGSEAAVETRLYQAGVSWQLAAPGLRVSAGRQFAPGIASVGLVDGVAAQVDRQVWSWGGFVGTEPEPLHLGFSNAVTVLGGFLERHSRTGDPTRWSVLAGASGSYLHAGTNREFVYLRGSYRERRLSIDIAQEADYYRPWRRVFGETAFSFTSTFATVQYQLSPGVWLTSGFDNRRNVRLYRDVVNPTSVFDDSFRRGLWGGVTAQLAAHLQAGFDVRTTHDSSRGTASTTTLVLGADRLTSLDLSLRSRTTRYTTPNRTGWLNAVTLGATPFDRGSLQLTAGWRSERDTTAAATLAIRWFSLELDVSVLHSLYMMASASVERGSLEAHDLLSAGLSYRF